MRECESVCLTLFWRQSSASASAAAGVVALPHLPVRLKPAASEKKKGTAEHDLSISAGSCCLEPFINIITRLCISPPPLSLSHPSVRVHRWWSSVTLRRVQTSTWRSFTQYVTCLLCLYPKSTSKHFQFFHSRSLPLFRLILSLCATCRFSFHVGKII